VGVATIKGPRSREAANYFRARIMCPFGVHFQQLDLVAALAVETSLSRYSAVGYVYECRATHTAGSEVWEAPDREIIARSRQLQFCAEGRFKE